jgi:hypothetical protein
MKGRDNDLYGIGEDREDAEPEKGGYKIHRCAVDVISEAEEEEECADHDGGQGEDTNDFGRAVTADFFFGFFLCVYNHGVILRCVIVDVLSCGY